MHPRRSLWSPGRFRPVRWALLAAALLGAPSLHAQQSGTITGRVTDAATLQPLASAQVSIPQLNIGVLTQPSGQFILLNVPAGTHTVQVQRIGYGAVSQAVTVAAGTAVTQNFPLTQEALALDEIVVTGVPGGEQRRAIGNAVGRVEAAAIVEAAPITDMQSLISSREPGVSIGGGNGQVGSGTVIRIRGASSLSLDNSPIVYVDGVRVDASIRNQGGLTAGGSSRLDDFAPEDIESIEIIKGPAAATLYGTEASNGVIQIITKRGVQGNVEFDFSTQLGAHWFPNPRRYYGTKWYKIPATGELVTANLYDNYEADFGRPYHQRGDLQYYHLGARGGSSNLRFSTSLDWSDEDGVVPHLLNERYSGRANLDFTPTENISIQVSTNYAMRYTEDPAPDVTVAPFDMMLFGTHPLHAPARRGHYVSVPEEAEKIYQSSRNERFTGSLVLNHAPASWLAQRLTVGIDDNHDHYVEMWPRHELGRSGPYGAKSEGQRFDDELQLTNYTLDWAATATVDLMESLESATSVGVQFYQKQNRTASLDGYVFPAPQLTTIGAAARTEASNNYVENKTLGVFIQERVGIGDNLYVTGALRADDNSAFGTEYDLAIYPKISATWSFDQPLQFAPWVDLVRLRGAWGAAGKQPDVFAAIRTFRPETGPGGASAVTPGTIGNPTLKPERSEEIEVGFDAAFFDNRTSVEFTYYNRNTTDAIVSRQLSPSLGYPGSQFINAGHVNNWGTELAIDTDIIRPREGGLLGWNLGIGFATMHNKLIDLGLSTTDRIQAGHATSWHVEGKPLAAAYGYRFLSADLDSRGRAVNVMCDTGEENNHAPAPWSRDNCPLVYWGGGQNPTWETNVTSSLTLFGNLRFTARAEGRGGHVLHTKDTPPRIESTPFARVIWERDDPVIVAYGQLYRDAVGFADLSHVRLKELAVNYDIPERWVSGLGVSRGSVGLSMANVAMLWRADRYTIAAREAGLTGDDLEGFLVFDPEMREQSNHSGFIHGLQPQSPTVLMSMRFSF